MPTYEYRCGKCEQHLEVFQSFSEAPLTRHEGCGGKLTKVLSAAGIVLKGSGFYKTDNRRGADGGRGKDAAAEAKPGAPERSSSGSGSGSKSPAPASGSGSTGSGSTGSGSTGSGSTGSEAKSA
jgi:putative FmdB family regulatory protein